ncbi:S1 family peptidase [Microbispora sp. CA-135349]|uniref:S1 family peptidase n=1 Tax=Microbispora sp. CA-135349 TaxID=3239953 RepID=UPI003D9380CC
MKRLLKVVLSAAVASILSAPPTTAVLASPAPPAAGSPEPTEAAAKGTLAITLSAQEQPKLERPTLEGIKRASQGKGISLEQAIRNYAVNLVKKNPDVEGKLPDGPVPDPDIDIDGIPYAELIDLQGVAKAKGISFEEAIDRYAWSPAINTVAAQLRAEFPDQLADVAIVDGGRAVRMGFKGDVPDKAISLAKTLPVEVNLYSGRGFSERELQAARESARESIAKRDDVALIISRYNAETGRVTFTVKPKAALLDGANLDNLASAMRPAQPSNPAIEIDIKIDDGLHITKLDGYLRGGGLLNNSSVPYYCTNGFNIINSSTNEKGSATARHCGDHAQYYQYQNHSSYDTATTTVGRAYRAVDFDLARYTGGSLTYTRTFYYDQNSPRYAHDVGTSPVIGQPVCKFGRTTGATCDDIVDTNVDITNDIDDGKHWYGNIETDDIADLGDSGGPLYYGNRAWGITSATTDCTICDTRSLFVAADRINDAGGMGSKWNVWVCSTC